tara:strand:- start:77 stop:1231 length:1155 start_codon:yes stop_codon:yes gene_type:complete
MSYFDSISQFQGAQEAIQNQSSAIQQEYKDKKANSIEEKFDYVDKTMEQLGGGIGGLAGGAHLTRKIYKKIKTARSNVQEARQTARDKLSGKSENNTSSEDPPNSHNGSANGEEDQPSNSQLKLKSKEAGQETGGGSEKLDVPETGEAQPAPDAPPAEVSDLDKLTNEEAESLFKEPDAPVKSAPSVDVPDVPEHLVGADIQSSQARGGGSLFGDSSIDNAVGGSKATSGEAGTEFRSILEPDLPDVIGTKAGAMSDTLADARGVVSKVSSKLTNGIDSASGMANDVKNAVGGVAKKVAGVGDDVMNVVSKAGEVLDILGPVGEVVGAGIALGSFFHSVFDKKRKEREEGEAEDAPMKITQSGGIDTTSMSLASVKSNTVGTLV